jgi:hypothetical protein
MGKLMFHYLPNLYVDESEADSASHIGNSLLGMNLRSVGADELRQSLVACESVT